MANLLSPDQLLVTKCTPLIEGRGLLAPDIAAYLAALEGWKLAGDAIERTFSFANYYETIAFVNALAWVVHAQDHHPDLTVSYNGCVVRFSTHTVKGISINDFICAAHADSLYRNGAKGPA